MNQDKQATRVKQSSPTDRYRSADTHMAILWALCLHPTGLTVKEVAKELDNEGIPPYTTRNLQIILKHLSERNRNIEVITDGRAKRFRWVAKRPVWMSELDDRERLILMLSQQHLAHLLPPEVLGLLRSKLGAPSQRRGAGPLARLLNEWPSKVAAVPLLPKLKPPTIDPEVLAQVSEALLANRWLNIDYCNAEGRRQADARVMPLALVQQAERLFLVCRFYGYENTRHLALHRINAATATPHEFVRPEFSLDEYIESGRFGFGNGELINLKIAVRPHLSGLLQETPLADDQQISPLDCGDSLVTATMVRSEQLRWWIRMHGKAIRLIEPATLLDEVDTTLPTKTPPDIGSH